MSEDRFGGPGKVVTLLSYSWSQALHQGCYCSSGACSRRRSSLPADQAGVLG